MRLKSIRHLTDGRLLRDGQFDSLGLLSHAASNMLAYLSDPDYITDLLNNNSISCVITAEELNKQIPSHMGVIVSPNPSRTFYRLHNHLAQNTSFYGKDFDSIVGEGSVVHDSAQIASQNIRIGRSVSIEPGVILMGRCIIEDDVTLRAGSIIGSTGFEFKRFDSEILSVRHAGSVIIRRGVEIQSFSNVDRAVFGGVTDIGESTKIGQHVYVAHHSRIGKRCMIAAHVMVGGSAVIGDDVWIGPGSMLSSNTRIGHSARITIGSVVTRDVLPDQAVSGNFAIDHDKFISFIKSIR